MKVILTQKKERQVKYSKTDKSKQRYKRHNSKPERKAYNKEWKRNNPSSSSHFRLELKLSMDQTRIRNNNTCQWYGCGLTSKDTIINVHHIFPRKEYPQLELISQYQICYCARHHYEFHKARGDTNLEFILGPVRYYGR